MLSLLPFLHNPRSAPAGKEFHLMVDPNTGWLLAVLSTARQITMDLHAVGRSAFDFFGWALEAFFQYRLEDQGTLKKQVLASDLRVAWNWADTQHKEHARSWERGETSQYTNDCTSSLITLLRLLLLFGQQVEVKWTATGSFSGALLRGRFCRSTGAAIGSGVIASEDIVLHGQGEDGLLDREFSIKDLFSEVKIKLVGQRKTAEELFP
jgi:hypothetical protein